MRRLVLVLGSDSSVGSMFEEISKADGDLTPVQVSYGKKNDGVSVYDYLQIKKGKEIESISEFVQNDVVVGVINRVDSYIPFWGKLVDEFNLPGSGFESVMCFKNKELAHNLMVECGLEEYRPKTQIVELGNLEEKLLESDLPIVVKPYIGAKSRGVFVVRKREDATVVVERLKHHFETKYLFKSVKNQRRALVEEYVSGNQVTVTCLVDDDGNLCVLEFVNVLTGKDVAQKHQQLVYRSVPAEIDDFVTSKMVMILETLVKKTGLKSTMLHPEFLVDGERVILIELNVRMGGFRQKLSYYSGGFDLTGVVVDLALGRKLDLERKWSKSVAAVEVWEDKSGLISKLKTPKSEHIKDMKLFFNVGDVYIQPPEGDKPLAEFYVVRDEGGLDEAKRLRAEFEIAFSGK